LIQIEFDNPYWVLDTLKVLNGCKDVVQLFSNVLFTDINNDTEHIFTGLAFQYIKKTKRSFNINNINSFWHPGFAWAMTRILYDKIGGLFEHAITGCGDLQMASCFLSDFSSSLKSNVSEDYKNLLEDFQNKSLGCRIGYIPGIIKHHYHGKISNRNYDIRDQLLLKYNYSPNIHVMKDKNGLLIPTNLFSKELKDGIMNHFLSKNEDKDWQVNNKINIKNILGLKNNNILLLNNNNLFNELDKLSIDKYITIHTINYRDINKLVNELNNIFISFNKLSNKTNPVKINKFLEIIDDNIKINNKELARYCDHINSMIYAYLHFNDYVIIIEDNIIIENILMIKIQLKLNIKD